MREYATCKCNGLTVPELEPVGFVSAVNSSSVTIVIFLMMQCL